ncbi:MAG: 30S ribosome-binding factor RbfA [bacterium]|nr:MAG: 30S ribosome-binding factor RbfA [bacterium]
MKFKRSLRISELIKREVSSIIATTIKDPSIKSVNITFVKVSDDLKHAKIYYRVIGDDQTKANALKGLERAKKFIRSQIGNRTELRYIPEIQFHYDTGMDDAIHIDQLIKQIQNPDAS